MLTTPPSVLRAGLLAAACLALAAPPAAAQAPADRLVAAVDTTTMRAHLEFLASDLLEGRAPGTRGGELAASYIATQFHRLGLEPAGDQGYYHRVPIISLTPEPTLSMGRGVAARPLRYRDDYVLWSMRNDSLVQAGGDLVFVGYGINAPEQRWNDYRGVDVRGKIVVALVNDPGLIDPGLFRGKILTYYGRWTYKIEEAARQGAAGILLVHTRESATYPWGTVTGSWTGPQVRLETPATSLLVAGWLAQPAAEELFRHAGQDLTKLAAAAARRSFRAVPLGVPAQATVRSAVRRSETYNVVARLPGTGPLAREAVLIGGHYDHLGIGDAVDGDSIYNGAEDNASGTAAVLSAAEAFVRSGVQPRRSIVFIAFAAEESGLLGSQSFAANPTLPLRDLAAALNLDVTNLYGATDDIAALGVDQSSLGTTFTAAAEAEGLAVTVNQDALIRGSFFRSDHFPLVRAGVPALSIEPGSRFRGRSAEWGAARQEEYNSTRYHRPQDEVLDWFTMAGAAQQLRVTLRTALAVADAAEQPMWRPTSEFHAAGEARVGR